MIDVKLGKEFSSLSKLSNILWNVLVVVEPFFNRKDNKTKRWSNIFIFKSFHMLFRRCKITNLEMIRWSVSHQNGDHKQEFTTLYINVINSELWPSFWWIIDQRIVSNFIILRHLCDLLNGPTRFCIYLKTEEVS